MFRIIITTEHVTVIARATMKDTETVKLTNYENTFGLVRNAQIVSHVF